MIAWVGLLLEGVSVWQSTPESEIYLAAIKKSGLDEKGTWTTQINLK
jgi:hypothetical protein